MSKHWKIGIISILFSILTLNLGVGLIECFSENDENLNFSIEQSVFSQSGCSIVEGGVVKGGNCLKLTGGNVKFEINKNVSELSISAWIKTNDVAVPFFSAELNGNIYSYTTNGYQKNGSGVNIALNGGYIYDNPGLSTDGKENAFADGCWNYITLNISSTEISYYKNGTVCYIYSGATSSDVKDFLDNFYQAISGGKVYLGSPLGNNTSEILFDQVAVEYNLIRSKNDLLTTMTDTSNTDETKAIIQANAFTSAADVDRDAPVLFYSFSNVAEGTTNIILNEGRRGTDKENNAVLSSRGKLPEISADGALVLNGNSQWLTLPDNMFQNVSNGFTLSFDFKRNSTSNNDLFYFFSELNGPAALYTDDSPSVKQAKRLSAFNSLVLSSGITSQIATDIYDNTSEKKDYSGNNNFSKTNFWGDKNNHTYAVTYNPNKGTEGADEFILYIDGNPIQKLYQKVDITKWIYNFIGGVSYDAVAANEDGGTKTSYDAFFDRKYFKGEIDNFAFYDYCADDFQISSLTNAVNGISVDISADATEVGNNYSVSFANYKEKTFYPSFSTIPVDGEVVKDKRTGIGYKITVLKRDPISSALNIDNVKYIDGNVLPLKYTFSYSDGSKETLLLHYMEEYEFFENKKQYIAYATDKSGRTVNLTVSITGSMSLPNDADLLLSYIDFPSEENYIKSSVDQYKEALDTEKKALENDKTSAKKYIALCDKYFLASSLLLANDSVKNALLQYEDINNWHQYCEDTLSEQYENSYADVRNCLLEAKDVEEINQKTEALKKAYESLNLNAKSGKMEGNYRMDSSGYSFSVPSYGTYSNTNFMGTTWLQGEFCCEADVFNPQYTFNQSSWGSIMLNSPSRVNMMSLRFFQEYYTSTTKPTDMLKISVSNYISELYEEELNEYMKLQAAEYITIKGLVGEEQQNSQNKIDYYQKQINDLSVKLSNAKIKGSEYDYICMSPDFRAKIFLSRKISENNSIVYITIRQTGMDDVDYRIVLEDYIGELQIAFGAKRMGVNFSSLKIKASPLSESMEDLKLLVCGEKSSKTENGYSLNASVFYPTNLYDKAIMSSAYCAYSFITKFSVQITAEKDEGDPVLSFTMTDRADLYKDDFIFSLTDNTLSVSTYGQKMSNKKLGFEFVKATIYRFVLAREIYKSNASYMLIIYRGEDAMPVYTISSLTSNWSGKVKLSVKSRYVSYNFSDYSVKDTEEIYDRLRINEEEYSAESVAVFNKYIACLNTEVSDFADMTEEEMEELMEDIEYAKTFLRAAKIQSYTAFTDISVDQGENIANYLAKKVNCIYDSGKREVLSIQWDLSTINTEIVGNYDLLGIVKDARGNEYMVSQKVFVVGKAIPDTRSRVWIIPLLVSIAVLAAATVIIPIAIKRRKSK